ARCRTQANRSPRLRSLSCSSAQPEPNRSCHRRPESAATAREALASIQAARQTQAGADPELLADLLIEQLIVAALEVRHPAGHPQASDALVKPLTDAQLRLLRLLPTSTYLQMADTLCISRNTV